MFSKKIFLGVFISITLLITASMSFVFFSSLLEADSLVQKPTANIAQNKLAQISEEGVRRCKNQKYFSHCYQVFLEKTGDKYDLRSLLQILKQIQAKDSNTLDCHVLAHSITKSALINSPDMWEEYLSIIDPYECNFGFIHGIIEARSYTDKSFEIDENTIPEVCSKLSKTIQKYDTEQTCYHIMGHLSLIKTEGNIDKAIILCKKLPVFSRRECLAGAFMENFTRVNLEAHGLGKQEEWNDKFITKIENICRSQDHSAAISCWQEISHLYNHRSEYDPSGLYRQCQSAKNQELTDACYIHGANTLVQNPKADEDYLSKVCDPYTQKPYAFHSCTNNIIHSLIYSNIKQTEKAIAYCSSIFNIYKSKCYEILGEVLSKKTSENERISWCKKTPQAYMQRCIGDSTKSQ